MLHVHRAERSDRLAEALAEVLAAPPEDPFVPDVVAVPTRGVERWLAQRLSHRLGVSPGRGDGVCANVVFPSPAELVGRALGHAEDDPWRPERLVWPLLEVVDDCAGESWCAPLGSYLGVDDASGLRRGRRFAAARHLARLFTAYGEHRPAAVRAWAAKDDADTPEDLRWQPELWRRLRERVGAPSPAEALDEGCRALAERPAAVDLPARVSLFGPTRLSATQLQVLAALASGREVHLWLPHPSPVLWERVAERPVAVRRAEDRSADAAAHPLLRSLARDVRELQSRLAPLGAVDHHHPAPDSAPGTLLALLQDDLRHDRAPAHVDLGPGERDDSVQVHSCHGPDRQVEVLREVVLGLLERDPTLEPRDVVVMCPDIETFAPLITASFGRHTDTADVTAHPGHRLQVRLADRALTQVNPLLGTVATLLELADARVTASQVLDLAESEPVRRRFRLDEDDLARLRDLAAKAGVRWGLDQAHRAPYKLGAFAENTWERGLDRLLVGVAMSGDEQVWLDTALPLDEVDSGDAGLVGRLAELVDRVGAVLDGLRGERPLAGWIATLGEGLDALTATAPPDAWQLTQARAELAEVLGSSDGSPTLTLHDVRAVLADRLRGRPTRANFRTGTLTVATLMPMRSVPHRVVCLLGLDDQVFPRETRADGDDVLARDPRLGERDPAAEDRQLLLDAITAATEHLVVVHSGADERTNAPRPPAVPVGELLDTLDATATFHGKPVRGHVVRRHPLQPFAEANFRADDAREGPFSFDRAQLAGARALVGERRRAPVFLDGPLPSGATPEVALEDLARFLEHPARAFLRQRLGIRARDEESEPDEALPVELDGLAQWGIGERLLADRLAGHDVHACLEAEVRRGTLPPGRLGDAVARTVGSRVEPLVIRAEPLRTVEADDVDVAVTLPDGTALTGTVPGVRGERLLTVTFSRVGAKHRLRAWVHLLALTAARPGTGWIATTIGRGSGGVLVATQGPVPPERAREVLADLVALHRQGLRGPLPLMTKTSEAYARARLSGGNAQKALTKAGFEWTSKYGGERDDPAHVLVWGRDRRLEDLAGAPLGAEPTMLGALAVRLWGPLRDAEEIRS